MVIGRVGWRRQWQCHGDWCLGGGNGDNWIPWLIGLVGVVSE